MLYHMTSRIVCNFFTHTMFANDTTRGFYLYWNMLFVTCHDCKKNPKQDKLALCMPWRHIQEERYKAALIIHFSTNICRLATACPDRLISWKDPQYQWNGRLGRPQSRCGRSGEVRIPLPLPQGLPEHWQPSVD
jgi:hypothetical protein